MQPTKLKKFKLIFWGSGGASSSHEQEAEEDEEEELDSIVDQDEDNDNVSFQIVQHINEIGDKWRGEHGDSSHDMVIPYNKG